MISGLELWACQCGCRQYSRIQDHVCCQTEWVRCHSCKRETLLPFPPTLPLIPGARVLLRDSVHMPSGVVLACEPYRDGLSYMATVGHRSGGRDIRPAKAWIALPPDWQDAPQRPMTFVSRVYAMAAVARIPVAQCQYEWAVEQDASAPALEITLAYERAYLAWVTTHLRGVLPPEELEPHLCRAQTGVREAEMALACADAMAAAE